LRAGRRKIGARLRKLGARQGEATSR